MNFFFPLWFSLVVAHGCEDTLGLCLGNTKKQKMYVLMRLVEGFSGKVREKQHFIKRACDSWAVGTAGEEPGMHLPAPSERHSWHAQTRLTCWGTRLLS